MGDTKALERKLSRDEIVVIARELLADGGVERLTMRRLGEACGVKGPALYWHFKDKDDLLGHIVDSVARDLDDGTPDQHWTVRLLTLGRSCRGLLQQHKGLAVVAAGGYRLQENQLEGIDDLIGSLVAGGLTYREALSLYYSVFTFTIGYAIYESSSPVLRALAAPEGDPVRRLGRERFEEIAADRFPHIGGLARTFDTVTTDEVFDQGLTALIEGWAARLEGHT